RAYRGSVADQDNTVLVRRTPLEVVAAAGAFRLSAGLLLLLRALASEGVIDEPEPDRFALGEGGSALLPAAAGGFRELILGWAAHPRGLPGAGAAGGGPAHRQAGVRPGARPGLF